MKILHCCLACFYIDDYSYQENILPKFHKIQGNDVKILASTETYIDNKVLGNTVSGTYYNEDGIEVTRINYSKYLPLFLAKKIRKYIGIYEYIDKYKPEVIFLHDCGFAGVFDIIKYCKKNKDVIVYADSHTDFINSANNFVSKYILHKIIYRYFIYRMVPYLEVFYGTTPLRCEFLEEVYNVPKHKIQLLNFGADDTVFNTLSREKTSVDFRKKNNIDKDSFLFITGGKIDERKNIHLIMQAFVELELPDVYLIVFGVPNDLMKKRLEKYKNVRNIIQLGWLNNKQIYEALLSSNFGLFPGTHSVLWEQSIGIGLPCAFKRWHGMEHVDVGANCVFFKEGSKNEIIDLINKIINSKKYFEKINFNAMKYGPMNFSYSEISKKAINKN